MKSKRILLAILVMAIFGWQSAKALDRTVDGLTYTTTGTLNEVSVRVADPTTFSQVSLVIPGEVEMYPGQMFSVVEIEDGAFASLGDPNPSNVYHFTSVTIPASVRKIGNYAFVNTSIDNLIIERDANSTLAVGLDAFGGTTMIIKEVKWGGSIRQWCEVEFASLYANPIAVKDWTASNTTFPRLTLTDPVDYINSETNTSASHIAAQSAYSVLVDRPAKSTTTQRKVSGVVAAYASTRLVLPADVTTINLYAFANRPFRFIKTMGAAPSIDEGTFSFIQNTELFAACEYLAGYNSHTEWKKAKSRKSYVDYVPGAIVNAPAKYIYSSINPTEVVATIQYTKPTCSGANAGQWKLTAVMEPGYQFNRWSGGDFNSSSLNPLTGDVDQAMPATAFVDRIIYTVGLSSNNTTMGTIGSNSQLSAYYNEEMNLTATANAGYRFVRWSNGNSKNPYRLQITSDTALVAYFEKVETVAGDIVYQTDFTDAAYDNNLWRMYDNGQNGNVWRISNGRLMLTSQARYASTTTYAFRRLQLKANTYYTLELSQLNTSSTYLKYALVKRSDMNNTDDFTYIPGGSFQNVPLPVSGTTTIQIDAADLPADGDYYLAFRWDNPYGSATYAPSIGAIKFCERKFKINTVMVPDSADGTLTGSTQAFASATGVVITATSGLGASNAARNFGYRFVGWYLDDPTCSGSAISTATSYTVPASYLNDDHTFYAKYEPKTVRLSLGATTGLRYLPGNATASNNQLLAAAMDASYIADNNYFDYDNTSATYTDGYNATSGVYYASERTLTPASSYIQGLHDQKVTIAVVPVDGYVFDKWSDGNTDNPRVITLNFKGNTSYSPSNANSATAYATMPQLKPEFKVREDYTVSAKVYDYLENREDNYMGTITGSGTYKYNQQVTLTATPKPHYTFVKWVDGNDKEYTTPTISFKVQGNNYAGGVGQNDASRQLKAYFEIEKYTVTIKPNPNYIEGGNATFVDPAGGSWVEGQGFVQTINYRTTVKVRADRFSGYKFTGWTVDGSSAAPILYDEYTFTPTSDITLIANFEPGAQPTVLTRDTVIYDTTRVNVNVPVTVYDTTRVNVSVPVTVYDTTTVTITNTVHQTVTVYDTTTVPVVVTRDSIVMVPVYINNPVYVDTVINVVTYNPIYVDTLLYRIVYKDSTILVPVYVNNPVYVDTTIYIPTYLPNYVDTTIFRPVYIDVPYYDTISVTFDTTICDTLTLVDTLIVNNYIHDTIYLTEYIHDTVYITDTIYVGIDDVETLNVKLFQRGGNIVVSGAEGAQVSLYDAIGRLLATKQDTYTDLEFDVPASGAYLIRVGDRLTRRIVVVR